MEILKRTRNQLGEADGDGRRAPEKRQRTEMSELVTLMPMPPPTPTPTPTTTGTPHLPPFLAAAPPSLRASTKIAPAVFSTVKNLVTQRIHSVVVDGWMRKTAAYESVKVLVMFWDVDEPDLGRDITSLSNLLSQTYKYEVEKLPLGSTLSNRDVTTRVSDFVSSNGSAATLLVLYYVGQSKPSPRTGELPVWTSYVSP